MRTPPALRRLRGCEVSPSEVEEMLQEQAEAQGVRPRRMWELFSDRSVRFQVISVAIISSAMQLCGNDSVSMHTHIKGAVSNSNAMSTPC